MGISDQLDAMRGDFPECRAVAFADLASGLVLRASTQRKLPQERLDRLCETARTVLTGEPTDLAARLLGSRPTEAVVDNGDTVLIFVRSPVEEGDAICLECDNGVDVIAVTARAARELASFGSG